MGFGDELLATGMARGARARGRRIAFGPGTRIVWGPWSAPVFQGNPNIAPPGSEGAPDLEWINHYKGNRLYNKLGPGRWIWNMNFRPQPGEVFLTEQELACGSRLPRDFVLIEPNVPWHKTVAHNKDWGSGKYQAVVGRLRQAGHRVVQLRYQGARTQLTGVEHLPVPSFRHALAVLSQASLYVGPEGGMHHGAAAVGVPGVVLFGGFIPPLVTGYPTHVNLTGGTEACGSLRRCQHCVNAMRAISVEEAAVAALSLLEKHREAAAVV